MALTQRPGNAVATNTPPNQSLYIQNLNEKLQKPDLKRNLYMLFLTYGPVIDITALKTSKMRGQAHVLFRDPQSATQAMRHCQGFEFFGREMVCCMLSTIAGEWSADTGCYVRKSLMPKVEAILLRNSQAHSSIHPRPHPLQQHLRDHVRKRHRARSLRLPELELRLGCRLRRAFHKSRMDCSLLLAVLRARRVLLRALVRRDQETRVMTKAGMHQWKRTAVVRWR